MPKENSKSDLSRTELILVRLAFLLAFGISAFLAWNSFQEGGIPGCGPESDCDKVLSSRWGSLFGIPVSAYALPVYAFALGLLFQRTLRWKLVLPTALTILAAALWFTALQAFALRAFCKFCMTAHIAGAVAALVLLRNNPLPFRSTAGSFGLAATTAAALIIGQLASTPPAPVQVISSVPAPTTSNVPRSDPIFAVVDGQFPLNLNQVPVAGPLNAPKKLAKLFDYTCHHCRALHHLLKPVQQKYSNELAVISLPMPLDANCNPSIKATRPAHLNACEYARIGLAVFSANPRKFEEFTEWVFTPESVPALPATRAYAENLVGTVELAAALNDPSVAEQIKTAVNIYVASSRLAKRAAMPQMLFARGGSIGAVTTAAQLDQILYNNLALGSPPATNAPASR